ncbi:MAG: 4-carboxymuconolactone decarboxylase [Oceanospirillaceae bacterium]|nr:4-carboxymuconolactone decarboxylase [Oceanospirillaceae bacterium]MBT13941.1 4-carboxymuconolactone decarboxylase [Oceanospirillaceae bacterium]
MSTISAQHPYQQDQSSPAHSPAKGRGLIRNILNTLSLSAIIGLLPVTAEAAESGNTLSDVSPALAQADQTLVGKELWQRAGLSARDRSLVTVAALVARNQSYLLPRELERALENGVKPAELSELINHLAYYAGWDNALNAANICHVIFADHKIPSEQLPAVDPELLSFDKEAEDQRQSFVSSTYGEVSQGVVDYTQTQLFLDLWRRPDLAPRDRSLITVSALVASGQPEQIGFHLNKAMDNGLKQKEAGEALTQLAFYAGWPKVFSALPVVKDVLNKRQK